MDPPQNPGLGEGFGELALTSSLSFAWHVSHTFGITLDPPQCDFSRPVHVWKFSYLNFIKSLFSAF